MSGTRTFIAGASGSGKSYFAKKTVADLDRLIVFDPEDEYTGGADAPRGLLRIESKKRLLEALQDCWAGSFKIAFVPQPNAEQRDLHEVSRLVEAMQAPYLDGRLDRTCTLLVEELNLSFPISPRPELDGFARLCSRGRKRGINIVGVSQRPAEVATRFRGNLDRAVFFRFSAPHDVKAVVDMCGDQAVGDALRKLEPRQSIAWSGGDWKVRPPI